MSIALDNSNYSDYSSQDDFLNQVLQSTESKLSQLSDDDNCVIKSAAVKVSELINHVNQLEGKSNELDQLNNSLSYSTSSVSSSSDDMTKTQTSNDINNAINSGDSVNKSGGSSDAQILDDMSHELDSIQALLNSGSLTVQDLAKIISELTEMENELTELENTLQQQIDALQNQATSDSISALSAQSNDDLTKASEAVDMADSAKAEGMEYYNEANNDKAAGDAEMDEMYSRQKDLEDDGYSPDEFIWPDIWDTYEQLADDDYANAECEKDNGDAAFQAADGYLSQADSYLSDSQSALAAIDTIEAVSQGNDEKDSIEKAKALIGEVIALLTKVLSGASEDSNGSDSITIDPDTLDTVNKDLDQAEDSLNNASQAAENMHTLTQSASKHKNEAQDYACEASKMDVAAQNVYSRTEEENIDAFNSGESDIVNGLPPRHTLSPDAASLAALLEDVDGSSSNQLNKAHSVYEQAVEGELDPDKASNMCYSTAQTLDQMAGSLVEAMQQLLQGSQG